ncbi:hypothetical protein [Microbacterium lacus]|uniref:hypothetical protein n=1 Tax=Microbacterium lacus TaxID=415217 RepID=UPI000C2C793A|nr:hypothetical protein [Microbacterium lacus]
MILGVDFSITGTGLAILGDNGATDTCTIKPPKDDGTVQSIAERLTFIADKAEAWSDLARGDFLVFESPLHHAPSAHRGKILGGWWITAARLARAVNDSALVVSPKTRAKYATGNGNADKKAVLEQVRARYPQFVVRNDNEADAVALVAIAARMLGRPIDPDLPETNLSALQALNKENQ